MCGIAGKLNMPDSLFEIDRALDAIAHRGPDGRGVVEINGAVHGHVRLALVDLTEASAQPYPRDGGVLSFVGEVWNWRELAAGLAGSSDWSSMFQSDTQVLAHLLARHGVEDTLPRLEGMFAFAWSDARGRHVLARDRFGKVPLHVVGSAAEGRWAWASELKGLGALASRSWALSPGTFVDMAADGGMIYGWYALPSAWRDPFDLVACLDEGVRLRLLADAPLCCLVSGGLDSSLILALAKRHKSDVIAYTAKLDEASPDLRSARRVCAELEVPLVEVPVLAPDADDLGAAVRAIETNMKAQVEIAAMCIPLARAIAGDGFKACLSGEAADELFGGYGSMCIKGAKADDEGWRSIRVDQLRKMARGNFMRCNKAFMAAGVECRLPFMHRPLVEGVLALRKDDCPPGKRALKDAARAILPSWVVSRQKDTFQGGAKMDEAAARAVANPTRFYRAELASAYGV